MSLEKRLGLKEDESLVAVARVAPVALLFPTLMVVVLILAPFFFLLPLMRIGTLGWIIIGAAWFLGLFFGLRLFIKWWFGTVVLTEKRLIIVRQNGFFDRQIIELPFAKIHDITCRVKGLCPTIFGYGTLMVESAGSDAPLEMCRLRRPQKLQGLVREYQEAAGNRGDFGEMLQAVSRMDRRKLVMLRGEIDRVLRLTPEDKDIDGP